RGGGRADGARHPAAAPQEDQVAAALSGRGGPLTSLAMARDSAWLASHLRDVPDFPQPGIVFKDLTPLLADVDAFRFAVDAVADHAAGLPVDKVVGIEARGFIFAAAVAYRLGAGFVPVRKPGKLPWSTVTETYALE